MAADLCVEILENLEDYKPYATTKRQEQALEALRAHGDRVSGARALGITPDNFGKLLARVRQNRLEGVKDPSAALRGEELSFTPIPHADIPTVELWRHREKQYKQKEAHEIASKLVAVKVKIKGPIGILHFGDPHVDDDGTDLKLLREHCCAVRNTRGLYGANIGDTTNAWIGRLAKLYAAQGTTEAQAWLLAEYFLHFCPDADPAELPRKERKALLANWLYLIGGNHDLWNGASDPINWITRAAGAAYTPSQVRLALQFPNGRECRINARHDFAGTSQWNPAHGSMKASQMGFHDHILVNGHKHKSGYGLIKDPANGTVSHCIQIASYKIHDRFAKERGFPDQHISPSVVTIIDPDATSCGLVTVFHDVEQAVDFLKFKRKTFDE